MTIAGTGVRGENPKASNTNMLEQDLTTPFDITYDPDSQYFYIAMSGIHQIWKLDLELNTILPMSGSGVEGCRDHDSDLLTCTWAQPSGVSIGYGKDGARELYIADSESSKVRAINLDTLTSSRTVVGGDGSPTNLFCYGDKDGVGIDAKLQHLVGLHFVNKLQKLFVADSYNHKIKLVDTLTDEIVTLYGNGSSGLKDGSKDSCQFTEPTDICSVHRLETDEVNLYIVDSSNDAIRKVCVFREGQVMLDQPVETIRLVNVPSLVDAVKSDMVECGESGCKWVKKKKNGSAKKEQERDNQTH